MTHSQVTGNMVIEDHVFFGGAVASTNDKYMGRTGNQFNGPRVKSGARVGANATILAGVTIGKEAVIGAGAVVTTDIPDYKVALGIPARVVKDVPLDQRLEFGKRIIVVYSSQIHFSPICSINERCLKSDVKLGVDYGAK